MTTGRSFSYKMNDGRILRRTSILVVPDTYADQPSIAASEENVQYWIDDIEVTKWDVDTAFGIAGINVIPFEVDGVPDKTKEEIISNSLKDFPNTQSSDSLVPPKTTSLKQLTHQLLDMAKPHGYTSATIQPKYSIYSTKEELEIIGIVSRHPGEAKLITADTPQELMIKFSDFFNKTEPADFEV